MMGFARIAGVSTGSDAKGKFLVYNIHLNGLYHCSLRYSQLLSLHNELKLNFDMGSLEEFPPKHLFSLSEEQAHSRKVMLERYLQSICQNRVIGPSELVKEYWLGTQRASCDLTTPAVDVDVFLVNGKSVNLNIQVSDRTDQILEQVCRKIELGSEFTYNFGLFIERSSDNTVTHLLTDYQSPAIAIHTANQNEAGLGYRLSIRQNFWDPGMMAPLLDDKVARNMLYIEALAMVSRGRLELPPADKDNLASLKSKGLKREYVEAMAGLAQCGYRQLDGFTFNHPVEGMEGCVRIGKAEIRTYTNHGAGVWAGCQSYPIVRIRSWKVGFDSKSGSPWLSLNHQLSRDEFVWVVLSGEHAVLLNLLLHACVNELLRLRGKLPLRTPGSEPITRAMREFPRFVVSQAPSASQSEAQRRSSTASDGTTYTDFPSPQPTTPTSPDVPTAESAKPKPRKSWSLLKGKSPDTTENPTFTFGTDDDL